MKKIILLVILIILPVNAFAMKIGLMSDQHTGSKKGVKFNMGIFEEKMGEIREKKADVIISCGDATSKGEASYFNQLKTFDDVIWVKGNHDGKKFSLLAGKNYVRDFKDLRVIVLDTTAKRGQSEGYLSTGQINFLKQAEQTEKDVIVATHHSPMLRKSKTTVNKKTYGKFMEALTPNVKMVVSGHWHNYYKTEKAGIKFIVVPATFSGQYLIEEL